MLALCRVPNYRCIMLLLMQVPPFKKAFADAMPFVDYLFGNETEAVAFAESEGWTTKNVSEIAAKVVHMFCMPVSIRCMPLGFAEPWGDPPL